VLEGRFDREKESSLKRIMKTRIVGGECQGYGRSPEGDSAVEKPNVE